MSDVSQRPSPDRRAFLKTVGAAAALLGSSAPAARGAGGDLASPGTPRPSEAPVRLGLDMFSLAQQGWTPFEQLAFAAKWDVAMVHFSEIRFLGSPDWQEALAPDNLTRIRERAGELGIDLEIGMRSICPTSTTFDAEAGTAEEQIGRMVDAAAAIGSPIVRCFLGSQADRQTGIDAHIDATIEVLRNVRSKVLDAGVKMAIENHAGDMQARELKRLVEESGPDFVGVTIDSGNAVWAIEDPHLTLDTLAPYVLTSHMRDSYVFNSPRGTAVQWCRMGEGNLGIDDYIRTYVARCPGRAVSLEVIVVPAPRLFDYRDPEAWEIFQTTPASEFARFLTLCERGEPRALPEPGAGPGRRGGPPSPEALQRNVDDVEASLRWTAAFLATL